MRAPTLLWLAAGRPSPRRETIVATGTCYWCASAIDGPCCEVADVISPSFTDQDQAHARSSPLLCVACAWSMTGRPPDTLRLWSIGYREDSVRWPPNHPSAPDFGQRIHAQNKADPSAFEAMLLAPPPGRWVCSIANSGQIHTAPFAPVNEGAERWGVRFERSTIWTTTTEYRRLYTAVRTLMTAGFGKGEIAAEPSPGRLVRLGIKIWRAGDTVLRRYRGGPLLDLVLFLTRRKDTDYAERRNSDGVRGASRAGDDEISQHGKDPADCVVEPREVGAGDGGSDGRRPAADGVRDGTQAPDRLAEQRDVQGDLFAHLSDLR